jgi:pilus assembly protein CpaB
MNQNRMLLGLLIAIVIAFALSTYVYRQFKQVSSTKPVVTGHIVVAASPLQLGTRVDSSNLRLIAWPTDEPIAGAFTRIEDCANRALITPVAANETILVSKLAA